MTSEASRGASAGSARGCPVDTGVQLWIESSMQWFTEQFGSRELRDQVVLPTARFLPSDYSATRSEIEHLVTSACLRMQVDRRSIDLQLFDGSAEKQAAQSGTKRAVGHFHIAKGRAVVSLDLAEAADPVVLLAIVAHELCHVRLLGEKRITADRKDHERLTDLLTVFFGFGIFSTNAAMRFDRRAGKAWIVPQGEFDDRTLNAARGNDGYHRLGYLSSAEFGYALGCYAWLRREADPGWSRFVNPGPLTVMRQSLSFLTVASQPGDLPTQRLLNRPIKVRNATVNIVRANPASSPIFGMAFPQAARESRRPDPPDKRK